MEMMEIYWILKLDDIKFFLEFMVFCVVLVLVILFWQMELNKTTGCILVLLSIILLTLSVFIPSTKQYLTMMGGHFLTTNDKVITTTEKGFELLDQYLDDRLEGATNAKPKVTN